jgi:hypothetical protein
MFDKQLVPFVNFLKKNSKKINPVIFGLVVLLTLQEKLPIPDSLNGPINELKSLISNQYIISILCFFLYLSLLANDTLMLTLVLFLLKSVAGSSNTPSTPPTPPN